MRDVNGPRSKPDKYERDPRASSPDASAKAWFSILTLLFFLGMAMVIDYNRRVRTAVPDAPIPGRYWGNPDAEFRIIEFWDLQNPEGVRGEMLVLGYLAKYPKDIFFQLRYFPQDERSLLITLYAECANRQGKFRPFLRLLFERHFQWMGLTTVTPILKTVASEVGLDPDLLTQCVASQDAVATVSLDRVYGESLFVRTTPTYFLNGRMVDSIEGLKKALEEWEPLLFE